MRAGDLEYKFGTQKDKIQRFEKEKFRRRIQMNQVNSIKRLKLKVILSPSAVAQDKLCRKRCKLT